MILISVSNSIPSLTKDSLRKLRRTAGQTCIRLPDAEHGRSRPDENGNSSRESYTSIEIATAASMTKADLLRIDGIGKPTAAKLVADGITSKPELKTVLQEVAPPARHIYSSAQAAVLAALDHRMIGAPTVAQYTHQPESDRELQYRWEREPESLILQLRKKPHGYRAEWSAETGKPLRGKHYDTRESAENTLTGWAYHPLESA